MGLPILYRYIMREIGALFIGIIIILLAIILSFRLARLLSAAVAGDMSLSAVWQLIGLQAINMLIILIPVSFILAAVMTLTRLYSEQEMSAIFASGIGRAHIHKVVFLIATPIAILLLYLTLMVMPEVYRQSVNIKEQARQQASFALLNANSFRRLDDGTSIHTGAQSDGKYKDFFIVQKNANENVVIFSDYGRIETQDKDQFLHLEKGIRVAWQNLSSAQDANYTQFDKAELYLPSNETQVSEPLYALPTAQLSTTQREHLAEWQTRLNPAIAMLIFLFLSAAVVSHRAAQRTTTKIVACVFAVCRV